MMLKLSHNSEGWRRVVLAISVIWLMASNALYFSDLGNTLRTGWDYGATFPTWMIIWYRATLGFAPELYSFSTFSTGNSWSSNSTTITTFEYSAVGHAAFVAIPLVLLIALTALIAWVAMGFSTGTKSIGKTDT